jgi:Predicted proteasome-type protease
MDSTLKSDLTVGPPIDLAVFKKDEKKLSYIKCLNTNDEDYKKICDKWSDKVLQVFDTFPKFDWEK